MSNHKEGNSATEFLIAEFNALQDRATSLEQGKSNRVNFFLVVAAAVGAGFANFIANQSFQTYHSIIIVLTALPLLVLGIFTLQQSIDDSISIVAFYRRAGRIRLWFVEHDVTIAPYVAFHYGDDRPRVYVPFLGFRGGEAVVLVINTVLFCTITVALLSPVSWTIAIIEIVVALFLGWFLQVMYVRVKLQRAEKKVKNAINFPSKEMVTRIKSVSNQ